MIRISVSYPIQAIFLLIVISLSSLLLPQTVQSQSNTIRVNTTMDLSRRMEDFVSLRLALIIAHEGGSTFNDGNIDKNRLVHIDLSGVQGQRLVFLEHLPPIDKEISISGIAQNPTIIDGENKYRLFFVRKGKLTLSNVILQNGRAQGGKGGTGNSPGGGGAGMGGAIFINSNAEAVCQNIRFIKNTAAGGSAGQNRPLSADAGASSAGGGFYGDANSYNGGIPSYLGGSGGYLGNEGKGGDGGFTANPLYSPKEQSNGGFGGGAGNYSVTEGNVYVYYGGQAGFGGGASGNIGSVNGLFGGPLTSKTYWVASYFNGYYLTIHSAGGGAGLGGAVFVREHGCFTAENCTFQENQALRGAANQEASYGQGKGGAIFIQNENTHVYLKDPVFDNNSASNTNGGFDYTDTSADNNDIYGSYQTNYPIVISMTFDKNVPVNNKQITCQVIFNQDVTGVDPTDFEIESDDNADTRIQSVEAAAPNIYNVVLTWRRGQGSILLKLIDDDSILDSTGTFPLASPGAGNGDFASEEYLFYPTYFAGSIMPLSGVLQDYGIKIQNGIDMAISELNRNVQTNGFYIQSQAHDNHSMEDSINTLIPDISSDIIALIGGAVSTHTLNMAEQCSQLQIPLFSPTSTSPNLSSKNYTANLVPLDNYQIDALHEVLTKFTSNQFFLIAEDSLYGRGFINLSREEGLTMTGRYFFSAHTIDTAEALQQVSQTIQSSTPTIVMAVYEDDANQLLQALAGSDNLLLRNAAVVLTDAAAVPIAIEGLPAFDALQYNPRIYGLRPCIPGTQTATNFATQYKNTHGTEPEWISYYGYDAVTAFAEVIKNAVEVTRQGIWEAIPWMRFEGVTGPKTFDDYGNLYSAAYDLYYVTGGVWKKADTLNVFQPQDDPESGSQGAGKVLSNQPAFTELLPDFTYRLTASDPLISHLAGQQSHGTGWFAESLGAPIGGVLMAYYEDIKRGLSTDNQFFVFEDGKTYYLTFNVFRVNQSEDAPTDGDILELTVKSVYRYQNGDGATHFERKDLLNQTIDFTGWPSDTSQQITIPITYESAAPDGRPITNEDNRLHWEIKLLNAAKQKVLLASIEIGTSLPTAVEDFMLH